MLKNGKQFSAGPGLTVKVTSGTFGARLTTPNARYLYA
mgnify:CR=1 FL=1